MNWITKLFPDRLRIRTGRRSVPEGLWAKCQSCNAVLYRAELDRNQQVCVKCGHHMSIGARSRLEHFLDADTMNEIGSELRPVDKFKFRDAKRYRDRISQAQKKTGESDSLLMVSGELKGRPVVAGAFDFDFMGGSLGSVSGERFAQGAEVACAQRVPMICFSTSGGARMQEALFSLLQMAKTSAACACMRQQSIAYISVLCNPTMGGVSASFASLGDINIAEPGALIGFAGPRVIEQTVRQALPEGFQRSQFLLEHGDIDTIIDRRALRDRIAVILDLLMPR